MITGDTYILVNWPDSQNLMEEDWFSNEAILNIDEAGAYFIPESRMINNTYIIQKVEELASQLESTEDEDKYVEDQWNDGIPFEGGMSTFESILNIKLNKSDG